LECKDLNSGPMEWIFDLHEGQEVRAYWCEHDRRLGGNGKGNNKVYDATVIEILDNGNVRVQWKGEDKICLIKPEMIVWDEYYKLE